MMNRFRRTSNNSQHQSSSSTKKRTIFSRNMSNSSSNSFHHPPLAQFDACIEACDALAASSSRQTSALVTERGDGKEANQDETLPECSVLVSPDGALLFTSNNENSDEKYPWTKSSSHHPTIGHEEEYESAILTGNDLTPLGDYDSNGFSARGWDADAASNALNATKGVLTCMEAFVEGLALCQKEKSASVAGCCGQWSSGLEKVRLQHSLKLEMGGSRVGPLLADGSSLANALEAMEQYYSLCAESSSDKWREACCDEYHRQPSLQNNVDQRNGENNATQYGDFVIRAIDESLVQGLVPKMRLAVTKAEERTRERELALSDIRSKVLDAQDNLMKQKEWSSTHWQRVKDENRKIDEQVKAQNELLQKLRLEQNAKRLEVSATEGTLSDQVWEIVKDVGSMEEFEHTGYSPRSPRKVPAPNENEEDDTAPPPSTIAEEDELPHVPNISRSAIEKESDIQELRQAALEADDLVEDAAGALLNIMSKLDTTNRSARVSTESGMLSECNAAYQCMRSLVEIERATLQEQMERLHKLEVAVAAVNVRNDIDNYIRRDKTFPGGSSRGGDNDDGGVAAALAVLNSHSDDYFDASKTNITRPSFFRGWADEGDEDDGDEIEPDFFKAIIKMLFEKKKNDSVEETDGSKQKKLQDALTNLSTVLSEQSQQGSISRQAILYELNNQRSVDTVIEDEPKFESLCNLFCSFLSGCGRESIDVSNAKMLMILSQTFYFAERGESDRTARIYVKNKISSHDIWTDDYFWDQALYQCVSESLKKSGVLLNYVKPKDDDSLSGQKNVKWHDLSPKEYSDAAAQVHSVVFAQLGTLSHSMLELGCGISRACNFVRRLSIRYQMPLSLRITLIQHLTKSEAKSKE